MNKLFRMCMMVAAFAIVFGVYASSSYGQTGTCWNGAAAPTLCNETTGYQINGVNVLVLPTTFGTAVGAGALGGGPDTGEYNTATGNSALTNNTTGASNTASGNEALTHNTTGNQNTASGDGALAHNTTGNQNTANGQSALYANTTGFLNTADGAAALGGNTIGNNNAASGTLALSNNTTGSNNTALGFQACLNVTTGSNVTCIGSDSGSVATIASNQTYIANVWHKPTGGVNNPEVCINKNGLLGTTGCAGNVQASVQAQQIADLQQRLARLESLLEKKSN